MNIPTVMSNGHHFIELFAYIGEANKYIAAFFESCHCWHYIIYGSVEAILLNGDKLHKSIHFYFWDRCHCIEPSLVFC